MPIPFRDQKRLNKLRRYLGTPKTIAEICERFEIAEITSYRWIRYLKEDGVDVVARNEGHLRRYSVAK